MPILWLDHQRGQQFSVNMTAATGTDALGDHAAGNGWRSGWMMPSAMAGARRDKMIGDGGRRSRRRCRWPLPLALSVAMPATIPATTPRPLRPAYPITASCGGHRRDGTWLDGWRCLGLNCPFPLVFQGCSVQSLGRQCAWRALGSVARDAFQTIPRRPARPTHRLLGIAPNAPESTRMRWFRLGQRHNGKGLVRPRWPASVGRRPPASMR
jgi:hypothetical protein